jgi:hypothetical protein
MEVDELMREALLQLSAKRRMLREVEATTKSIVVGSSHGDCSFDPKYCDDSFNLCFRALDLKHSYFLYKRMAEFLPKLENVVVFYSIFSPGNFLEKSPDRKIGPILKAIFQLESHYQLDELTQLHEVVKSALDDGLRENIEDGVAQLYGFRGFLPLNKAAISPEKYEERLLSHIKLNYQAGADVYLYKILALADRLGHKVCLTTSPMPSACRRFLQERLGDPFQEMREAVSPYQARGLARILDFYHDDRFQDEHFIDIDHLNPTGDGVRIVSQTISEALQRFETTTMET